MTRRSRGFTLIELLVVISILGVVTTLGTLSMVQLWERWADLQRATELDRTAENIFDSIHKDIASAVNSTVAGVALQGTRESENDARFYGQSLSSDRFTVPVEIPVQNGTVTALAGYHVDRKEGTSVLVRTIQPLAAMDAPAKITPIANGVIGFRVEYAGTGGGWSENWVQAGNPRAVRVSILLVDPNSLRSEQVARKAVIAVHVP